MVYIEKKILLRHDSGWCIVYDYGFPSGNYIVMKADESGLKERAQKSKAAYCGSLESALNCLYRQIIIEHAGRNKSYCGRLQDLRRAIDAASKDFEKLLKPKKRTK